MGREVLGFWRKVLGFWSGGARVGAALDAVHHDVLPGEEGVNEENVKGRM